MLLQEFASISLSELSIYGILSILKVHFLRKICLGSLSWLNFSIVGDELSLPVLPYEEDVLYQPSQHLCDLIRQAGFDGIAYRSAMGNRFNVVLFDPKIVTVLEIKYHRITQVCHHDEELGDGKEIYDELPYDYVLSKRMSNSK